MKVPVESVGGVQFGIFKLSAKFFPSSIKNMLRKNIALTSRRRRVMIALVDRTNREMFEAEQGRPAHGGHGGCHGALCEKRRVIVDSLSPIP